jgi:hypothetical protein
LGAGLKTVLNVLIPAYKFNDEVKKLIGQLADEFPFSLRILFCLNGSYEINQLIKLAAMDLEHFHEVHYFYAPKKMPIGYYREYLRLKAIQYPAPWNLFLDADDSLEVKTLKDFALNHSADVVVYEFNDPGNPFINSKTEVPFSTMAFYTTEVFRTVPFAPMRRMEDQVFNLQVCRNGFRFTKRPETLIHITKDPESITRKPVEVTMKSVFEEAQIAQSVYGYREVQFRYVSEDGGTTEFYNLLPWITADDYSILKVLMVDRNLHKQIPFLDTDTQVLLFAIDSLEEEDLDVVRASEVLTK